MLIVNNVVVIIFSHLIKLYGEKSPRVPVHWVLSRAYIYIYNIGRYVHRLG